MSFVFLSYKTGKLFFIVEYLYEAFELRKCCDFSVSPSDFIIYTVSHFSSLFCLFSSVLQSERIMLCSVFKVFERSTVFLQNITQHILISKLVYAVYT